MIFILILVFGAILSVMGPWWISAAVSFIVCRWKATSAKQAFGQSALSLSTLWLAYATFINMTSEVNMANKIAAVLTSTADGFGPIQNGLMIFGITSFLAITIGGLAGLAGYKLKEL
jgi:hypothetical protein